MIRRLIVAYPNQAPKIFDDEVLGEEAVRLWKSEFNDMERTFGARRVENSIVNWIRRSEYMPEVSQIRDGIVPEMNPASRFDPECICRGTGFREVMIAGHKLAHLRRCDCWKKKARTS